MQPVINFYRKLRENPSATSQRELLDCLERNKHPLFEDGDFLAWKGVGSNFMDKYVGKFDNHPGQQPTVSRGDVDDDRSKECSFGLHVGSYEYARNYAGSDKLMLVKVNPKHAVSVPKDANFQKMRVESYLVLREAGDNPLSEEDNLVSLTDTQNPAGE